MKKCQHGKYKVSTVFFSCDAAVVIKYYFTWSVYRYRNAEMQKCDDISRAIYKYIVIFSISSCLLDTLSRRKWHKNRVLKGLI